MPPLFYTLLRFTHTPFSFAPFCTRVGIVCGSTHFIPRVCRIPLTCIALLVYLLPSLDVCTVRSTPLATVVPVCTIHRCAPGIIGFGPGRLTARTTSTTTHAAHPLRLRRPHSRACTSLSVACGLYRALFAVVTGVLLRLPHNVRFALLPTFYRSFFVCSVYAASLMLKEGVGRRLFCTPHIRSPHTLARLPARSSVVTYVLATHTFTSVLPVVAFDSQHVLRTFRSLSCRWIRFPRVPCVVMRVPHSTRYATFAVCRLIRLVGCGDRSSTYFAAWLRVFGTLHVYAPLTVFRLRLSLRLLRTFGPVALLHGPLLPLRFVLFTRSPHTIVPLHCLHHTYAAICLRTNLTTVTFTRDRYSWLHCCTFVDLRCPLPVVRAFFITFTLFYTRLLRHYHVRCLHTLRRFEREENREERKARCVRTLPHLHRFRFHTPHLPRTHIRCCCISGRRYGGCYMPVLLFPICTTRCFWHSLLPVCDFNTPFWILYGVPCLFAILSLHFHAFTCTRTFIPFTWRSFPLTSRRTHLPHLPCLFAFYVARAFAVHV